MRSVSLSVLALAIGFGAGVAVSTPQFLPAEAASVSSETYRQLSLFGDVFERVRADYVEEPDDANLIDAAISGMLTSLDPHSSYLNPKNFRDMQVQTRGEFGGLGIEVTMENGLVKVVSPIDDTPAAKAGVLAGDLITHLNDEPVQGLTLSQAVERMRGPVNTPITLRVLREGAGEPLEIKVVRDIIRIRSVRSRVEEGDIGYIRITTFNDQTFDGVKSAIANLSNEIGADKVRGYIIDLRNNPGGLLDQAIEVSDAFLERGEILSTRGRNEDESQRYNARSGDLSDGKPIIVLMNGGSASASEIVAGALQDHFRATILGTRSFGKGSVQTIIPLGANGAIRLTTARYFTPSGRSIQAKGIDPDILVEQELPDELKGRGLRARNEASLRGHLENETGGDNDAAEDPATGTEPAGQDDAPVKEEDTVSSTYVPPDRADDKQLLYAVDLLKGNKKDESFPPNPEKAVQN